MDFRIVPPIVACDQEDVVLFPSVELAQLEFEAIDVVNGVYEVFDSTGRRLDVAADSDVVRISINPWREAEPEELVARLRLLVSTVGPERIGLVGYASASLEVLVRALRTFFKIYDR